MKFECGCNGHVNYDVCPEHGQRPAEFTTNLRETCSEDGVLIFIAVRYNRDDDSGWSDCIRCGRSPKAGEFGMTTIGDMEGRPWCLPCSIERTRKGYEWMPKDPDFHKFLEGLR